MVPLPRSTRASFGLVVVCSYLLAAGDARATQQAHPHSASLGTTPVRRGGEVRIVAPSGGDFTTIQAAVNAAAPGDTVLVKHGSYPTFTVDGKGINVVEEAAADVQVNGLVAWRVRNIPAGEVALIAGLRGDAATVSGNPGSVRFESCTITGYIGVIVADSPDVCFSGSIFTSGDFATALGYSGLTIGDGSSLALYHCDCTGSAGPNYDLRADKDPYGGFDGGHGIELPGFAPPFLFAAGCTLQGGRGGNGACPGGTGGDGGWGIFGPVESVGLQCAMFAGSGGDVCGVTNGASGSPGAFGTTLPGSARRVSLETPVRDKSVVPIGFVGEPGDVVSLYISRSTAHVYDADLRGVRMVDGPYSAILYMGVVPPSGTLNSILRLDDRWTPPHTATLYFAQAVFADTGGGATLSNPVPLVVLDNVY